MNYNVRVLELDTAVGLLHRTVLEVSLENSLEKSRHLKKLSMYLDKSFVYHSLSWPNFDQSDQQTIKHSGRALTEPVGKLHRQNQLEEWWKHLFC